MRLIAEKQAIETLRDQQERFAKQIQDGFEHRAASCLTCSTPGACCLDAHFVNVHISRLESAAIRKAINDLDAELRAKVLKRIDSAIDTYRLTSEGDTYQMKFACPLFEKGSGCLVHDTGKPVACTVHACYENAEDLPPNELQFAQEQLIDDLNARTYGRRDPWLPLPLAIRKVMPTSG